MDSSVSYSNDIMEAVMTRKEALERNGVTHWDDIMGTEIQEKKHWFDMHLSQ
ncbi:hypothetical protein [Wolbachia endosymbiont of Oryzaephilus surinamensis]|uniref:hypothetical protein n=1 Tax=Wolbachia endosymbiont of Oryzaephilus surinamensis TaxID=573241 RepID=UPI000322370C|nr:hypothetical protein [Wolbachia endosymbiont of Oryzaephilus surinamensis]UXX40153.1 hypothetical protein MJ631_06615 [Wolbachia endosymbiont of Oryzaephilus surinamensis]CQD08531.1 Uncharacterised protein [Wolbachia endosymbiont wPip_Mol of Culex molestus]